MREGTFEVFFWLFWIFQKTIFNVLNSTSNFKRVRPITCGIGIGIGIEIRIGIGFSVRVHRTCQLTAIGPVISYG